MGRRIPASRKIVNALLSMVLVLGLLPAPAFAEGAGGSDAAGPAVTATQGGQDDAAAAEDSSDAQTDSSVCDFDYGLADGASALSEGGASLTPGWTQWGTCEWKIDAAGLLTVRPLGDGASGELADRSGTAAAWYPQRETIKSAVIEPGVSAGTCDFMFSGCSRPLTCRAWTPRRWRTWITCSAIASRFPPWTCRPSAPRG